MNIKNFLVTTMVLGSTLTSGVALACESKEMVTTETGLILKVVAGSDQIRLYDDTSGSKDFLAGNEPYTLELLQPYFVICEDGDYYRVTDFQTSAVEEAMSGNVGYVKKAQVHPWPTREALNFSEIAFLADRPEIVAWDEEAVLEKFLATGNAKLHSPAFWENLEETLLRERTARPYPVLASAERKLRGIDKRVYEVLIPVAIRPTDEIIIDKDDVEVVRDVLTSTTILVVYDATASMGIFGLGLAKSIREEMADLPRDVRVNTDMGFLFFRDENDEEKFVVVPPIPLYGAANALEETAHYMEGGGDAAEPILDALYYASNIYPWGVSGRKIIVAVLSDDAKPATIGTLGNHPQKSLG